MTNESRMPLSGWIALGLFIAMNVLVMLLAAIATFKTRQVPNHPWKPIIFVLWATAATFMVMTILLQVSIAYRSRNKPSDGVGYRLFTGSSGAWYIFFVVFNAFCVFATLGALAISRLQPRSFIATKGVFPIMTMTTIAVFVLSFATMLVVWYSKGKKPLAPAPSP